MKSILRSLVLLSVVLLVTSGFIHAQAPGQTFCGDLSTEDCTLLTESQVATQKLSSSSFDLDMSLDLSGLPTKPNDMSIKLTGNGSFVTDTAAISDIGKMDAATLGKAPKAIFDLLNKLIPAISSDLHFTLDLPADFVKQSGDPNLPQTVNLSLKLVDGIAYVNVGELGEAFPQLKGMKGWMGMSLPDLITTITKQPGFGASMSSMHSGMNMGTDMTQLYSDPKNLAKFLKIERLPDGEVSSTKVAVFKTTLDYGAMFDMPEMQAYIKQQMQSSGSKISDKDFSAAMLMLRGLARDMEFTVTQNIGLEDKYIHQTSINMKFDLSSLKAQMFTASVITLNATVTQSDFNAVKAIEAPEGALVMPADNLIPNQK